MQAVSEKSELGEDSRAGKLWEGFLEEGVPLSELPHRFICKQLISSHAPLALAYGSIEAKCFSSVI